VQHSQLVHDTLMARWPSDAPGRQWCAVGGAWKPCCRLQLCTELVRCSALWHEIWHNALTEASRLHFEEGDTYGRECALGLPCCTDSFMGSPGQAWLQSWRKPTD
jgi:hypothetical protein